MVLERRGDRARHGGQADGGLQHAVPERRCDGVSRCEGQEELRVVPQERPDVVLDERVQA